MSADTELVRARFLDIIDREYDRVRNQSQRPGWTPWAMSSAAAALLWLFFDVVSYGIDWSIAFRVLVIVCSILFSVIGFVSMPDFKSEMPNEPTLLFGVSGKSWSGSQLLIKIVLLTAIFVGIASGIISIVFEHRVVACIMYGLLLNIYIFSFVKSFGEDLGGVLRPSSADKFLPTAIVFSLFLSLALFVVSARDLANLLSNAALSEHFAYSFKAGMLLSGFALLCWFAAPKKIEQLKLEEISALRGMLVLTEQPENYEHFVRSYLGGVSPSVLVDGLMIDLHKIVYEICCSIEKLSDISTKIVSGESNRDVYDKAALEAGELNNLITIYLNSVPVIQKRLLRYARYCDRKDEVQKELRYSIDVVKESIVIQNEMILAFKNC